MTAADVQAAFERGVRECFIDPPGDVRQRDKHLIHVSDTFGCPEFTRARILRKPMLPRAITQQVKFQVGRGVERDMIDAIESSLDETHDVFRDVLIYLHLSPDGEIAGGWLDERHYPDVMVDKDDDEIVLDPAETIVGHADAIFVPRDGSGPSIILECKSKDRKPPDRVPVDYDIQARYYGLMEGLRRGYVYGGFPIRVVVGVVDRGSGEYRYYDVPDVFGTMGDLTLRGMRTLSLLEADAPPDFEPPAGYCKSCEYGDCARNQNPERYSLEGVL